jgi:hypothetical protein
MAKTPQNKRDALADALTKAQAAQDRLVALPVKASRTAAQNTQAARHTEALARQSFRALRLYLGLDQADDVTDTSEA